MSEDDDMLKISKLDLDNLNDFKFGLLAENKDLHSIIKYILGIEDDRSYIPEVYMKIYNDRCIVAKDNEDYGQFGYKGKRYE